MGRVVALAITLLSLSAQAALAQVVTTSPLGTVQAGDPATCTYTGLGTGPIYKWQLNLAEVAQDQTYTVPASTAAGTSLTCSVTATLLGLETTISSLPVVVTAADVPELPVAPIVGPPIIEGTPQSGRTVTCSADFVLNASPPYTYQWLRDASNIAGATAAAFALTDADVGKQITCKVTATNSAGSTTSLPSLRIVPVAAGLPIPLNVSAPMISGTTQVGNALTCAPGTWVPDDVTYGYQWNSSGSAIGGMTAATYTVREADAGNSLTCTVTATNSIGSSRATSAAVTPTGAPGGGTVAKPTNLDAPELSGRAREGQTLSCTQGTWTGAPTAYIFRWARGDALIGRADQSTYRLRAADVGQNVGCAVAARNSAGYGVALSDTVGPVAAGAPAGDRKRPSVTKFKFKPKRLVLKRRKGAFHWRLSEPARVTIVVKRKLAGQRKGKRCRPASARRLNQLPRRERCTRWKPATKRSKRARKGSSKMAFSGQAGKRTLPPGSYRAWLTATDAAGNKSGRAWTNFKLVVAKRPR